jgi:hypothetical protein
MVTKSHVVACCNPQLSNPIAHVISVPFQFNYDCDIGPEDEGQRYTLNIQPVEALGCDPIEGMAAIATDSSTDTNLRFQAFKELAQ